MKMEKFEYEEKDTVSRTIMELLLCNVTPRQSSEASLKSVGFSQKKLGQQTFSVARGNLFRIPKPQLYLAVASPINPYHQLKRFYGSMDAP